MTKDKGGLGLENLGNLSSFLTEEETTSDGKPLNIDLNLIDEDPEQPRIVFSKSTLNELAESIKLRGVKTPISVRSNKEGRFIINHGARRYRASILAAKETIPAYIDLDYSKADQVIENLHRDNLTSREIAEYIGRQLSAGQKKSEIATEIGKSASFVTQHYTLLNLPDELAELYNSGKCNDVTVIYEFAIAYKKNAEEVVAWIKSNTGEWNRANVKLFKEYISANILPEKQDTTGQDSEKNKQLNLQFEGKNNASESQEDTTGQDSDNNEDNQRGLTVTVKNLDDNQEGQSGNDTTDKTLDNKQEDQSGNVTTNKGSKELEDVLVNGVITIEHKGKKGEIILNRFPSSEGRCWVDFDGEVLDIKMKDVKFVSLLEG